MKAVNRSKGTHMHEGFRVSSKFRIMAVLVAIMLILGVVALLAFSTTTRMITDRVWVAHTQEVLAELQEMRALIDVAEDQERGYLITGNEELLATFKDSQQRFLAKLEPLRRLTADDDLQQKRLEDLSAAADAKFIRMRELIETRRRLGPRQARSQVASDVRHPAADEPRVILLEMVALERDLLRARLEQARSSDLRAIALLALLMVSFLGCLTTFFLMIWRSLEKQAQSATELRKSRERFELAVRGSNDGLWDWDIEGDSVFFSPRWKSQLGYADDEIAHQFSEFESRLHPDDHDRVMQTVKDYLDGSLSSYSVEFRMRCKDGSYRWILARGLALRDGQGKPYRMAGSHTDITERKEFESKLAEQNALLERAMAAERKTNETLKRAQALMVENEKMAGLGHMVAGVAHEINNPLAFITNNVAILQRDFDEICQLVRLYESAAPTIAREAPDLDRQIVSLRRHVEMDDTLKCLPELMARTAEGLKRIRQIVGDLRLFARLDEGEVNEADLNAGIRSTVTIIQGHAKNKDVSLDLQLAPLPAVTCHAARVNQVVMNLLSNAIDACERGGKITVRSGTENGQVKLDVIDNGQGISPAIRGRIFDPFFTTKPIGKGTGLGLSISYAIVQDHGGTIDVDSTPGKGSRFTVKLPVRPLVPMRSPTH
jgi:PAS domain S-box-containing protein